MERLSFKPDVAQPETFYPYLAPLFIATRSLVSVEPYFHDLDALCWFLPNAEPLKNIDTGNDVVLHGFVLNNRKPGALTVLSDEDGGIIEISAFKLGYTWGVQADLFEPTGEIIPEATFTRKGQGKQYKNSRDINKRYGKKDMHSIGMDWRIATIIQEAVVDLRRQLAISSAQM